jgi:restriction endonuclease S subunit
MKKYDTYKDSGNQWIGQVPEHWTVKRLKYLAQQLQSGGTPTAGNPDFYTDEADGIPWVAIGDMSSKDVVYDTTKHITEAGRLSKNLKVYPIGTLLYSIYATLGKVSELACPAAINQAILAISLHKDYMQSFCKYVLKAQEKFIVSLASSNTQANLNAEKVANFLMPVPPLSEQQAIVEFLDKKTGQIDQSIALLETQKTDLQAYRQALITETVTKGLNPSAPMKDSGIQWIGEIPEGWKVFPLKRYAMANSGKEIPAEIDSDSECAIPVYGSGGIFKYTNQVMYSGEAVMFGRKGTIGKPLYVNTDFWTVDTMYYITFDKSKLLPKYNYYQFLVFDWGKYTTQTALPSIVAADILKCEFSFPPLSEQQAIADYLDKKTNDIDAALMQIDTQIADLQAYRTALISEAVTGKIDVR